MIRAIIELWKWSVKTAGEAGEEKLPGELPRGSSNCDIFEKLEE